MDTNLLSNYTESLINMVFKILPLWENGEASVITYVEEIQRELLGYRELVAAVHEDAMIVSLLAKLQYLIDHPESDLTIVRREVFGSIDICKKMRERYTKRIDGSQEKGRG